MTKREALNEKPHAGNPHVWSNKSKDAPAAAPRCRSLLHMGVKAVCCGLAAFALSCATHGYASTVYVDCRLPGYAGHDGSSWDKAFKTIQEGVDASQDGGLVLVAPGHYAEGGAADAGGMNRVYVTKAGLTICSQKGASVTHIVGARDAEAPVDHLGNGPNAVRCVFLGADNVVVEGFTLRDGAAHPVEARQNSVTADGGGVRSSDSSYRSCIVDCVVSNCVGVRGAGMRYATAVRTLFTGNAAIVKGLAGNQSSFLNCVIDANRQTDSNPVAVNGKIVNCAFMRHGGTQLVTEKAQVYNSVFMLNGGLSDASKTVNFFNCAIEGDVYSSKGTEFFQSIHDCITNISPYMMVAPIFGDYRLTPDSAAIGIADASYLTNVSLPVGVDRYLDFNGASIPSSGMINAGPVQTVADSVYGGLCFDGTNCTVNGESVAVGGDYFFVTNWPEQCKVVPANNGSYEFWGFLQRYPIGGTGYHFPLLDGTTWMLPPPRGITTNELKFAASTVYADPGAPDGGDGSRERPFNTLQAAVDACPLDSKARSIVHAAAGTYSSDVGVLVVRGVRNRLTVDRMCRVIGAGAGVTFLAGASDPEGPAGDGRGTNAMRSACITVSGGCIQGFTLCGGRSGYPGEDGTANENGGKGGGAMIGDRAGSGGHLCDCVVSNAVGYRGAVFGGYVHRVRIVDSEGYNGLVRYCRIVNCVLDRNRYSDRNSIAFGSNSEAYGCTFVGASADHRLVTGGVPMTNCIIHTTSASSISDSLLAGGCYLWNVEGTLSSSSRVTLADPQMVSVSGGDYRLLTTSPLYGGGVWGDSVWMNFSPSIDGKPLKFRNGMPTPGACHDMVQGVVSIGGGGAVFTPSGTNVLEAGTAISVSYDASGVTRPILGVKLNGELVEVPPTSSWTFTAPPEGEAHEPFTLEVVCGTNWYVNAGMPDNSGDGFTAATAKRTFHGEGGLFTVCDVRSGDCVHAAPGVYSEGVVCDPGERVATRVAVPVGVALVADEGPHRTFLVGAGSATDEFRDWLGRGTNAVRTVFLHDKAGIKGFTVAGGRTLNDGNARNETYGGGILCDSTQCHVEGCIISNNAAVRDGGVHGGTVKSCLIVENWASMNRAGASESRLYNCVVDRNRGQNASQNLRIAVNCTFGSGNTREDGITETFADAYPQGPVVNCLFLGQASNLSDKDTFYSNCVFAADSWSNIKESQLQYVKLTDCISAEADNLKLDRDYAPVFGSCAAIDAGSLDLLRACGEGFAQEDMHGGQRVYNGALDVGAVEFDYRPVYRAALGGSVASVERVSPGAVMDNGSVRLSDGDEIAIRVAEPGRYCLSAEIEDGVLSADIGDGLFEAASSGRWWVNVRRDSEMIVFGYSGNGMADILKFGRLGTVVVFR